MSKESVGVLGGTSIVGECLLSHLAMAGFGVEAFSRQKKQSGNPGINWHQFGNQRTASPIPDWIALCPVWVLPAHFEFLESCGIRTLVALSSTSRYTKADSADVHERQTAIRLLEAEKRLADWADAKGVDCCVLRPTLIYGYGRDSNISEIARIIRRYHFFPLFGKASGLRQPVHADDVAQACMAALDCPEASGRSFNLSGGETLSYRTMVERIFQALGRKPRFVFVPLFLFRLGMPLLRLLPRYRHWTPAMVERMNRDLVFDHGEARRALGFSPREFVLTSEDLPVE